MMLKRWNLVDEGLERDKVKRLEVNNEGWLVKVLVVDRDDTEDVMFSTYIISY